MKRNIILIVAGIVVLVAGKLVTDHLSDVDGFIKENSAVEESAPAAATAKATFQFKTFDSAEAALREARTAFEAGFDVEADANLKQALKLAPNRPDVLLAQASREFAHHDFSNTLAIASRLLDQSPTNATALSLKGAAELELGRTEAAAATLGQAIAEDSRHPDALHSLGRLHHRSGAFDLARDFYVRALAIAPAATNVFTDLHHLFQDEAKEGEFTAFIRSQAEPNPAGKAPLLRGLARITAQKKQFQETSQLLAEAGTSPSQTVADLIALADIHYRSLEPEKAIELFDRAIALAPDEPEPLAKRAFSQAMLRRTNECIADLSAAFLFRADFDLHATYNRVVTQFDIGRTPLSTRMNHWEWLSHFPLSREFIFQVYDEAERRHPERRWFIDLQRAVKLDDTLYFDEAIAAVDRSLAAHPTAAAYHQKAITLRNQRRYDDALQVLASALQLAPDNPEYWMTKGKIHQWKQETEPAWKAFKEALYHDPDYHPADEALRDMWLVGNHFRGLQRDYEDLIARRPAGEFFYRFHRANHMFPRAQYEMCLSDLNRTLELRPGDEGSRRLRAWALKFMGRYDEALAACDDLKRYDQEYHARLLRSTIYVETGKNEEALREIEALMKAGFGGGNPAYLIRARALANLNRMKEAEESYRRQGGPVFVIQSVNTCYLWNIDPPGAEHYERAWFSLFAGDPKGTELHAFFAQRESDQRSRSLWMILVGYFSRLNQGRLDDANKFLASHTLDGDECTWPYTMFRYLNGELPAEVVIARAQEMRGYTRDKSNQPQYGDSHEVLVRSLLGMQAAAMTNLVAAREQFQWIADHPTDLQLPAYHYAKARLAELERLPAAASPTVAASQPSATAPPIALTDGLVVHLPLKDDLNDHSPSAHPVRVQGNIKLDDGAARFPGDGNFLELPFVPLQRRDFSVSFWARVGGTNDTCTFFSQKEEDKCGGAIYLQLRQFSQLYLGFWNNDVTAPSAMEPREAWNHVVFQYVNFRQQIWLNGRLLVERIAEPLQCAAGGTRVGGQPPAWTGHHDFEGWMRDFRIYNRALQREEIHQLAGVTPRIAVATAASQPSPLQTNTAPPVGPTGAGVLSAVTTLPVEDRPFLQINGNHLTVSGPPVQVYELQASFDLADGFKAVSTLTNLTGSVQYVDPVVSLQELRFYRVKVLSSDPSR